MESQLAVMEVPRGRESTPCPPNDPTEAVASAKEGNSQPELKNLEQFITVGVKQCRKKPKPPEKKDFLDGDQWQKACKEVVVIGGLF